MSKFVVTATWDDVPHLTEEVKKELLGEIPAYQRDARTKGVPQLGAGAIYPISEDDIVVPDFDLPIWFPRGYGMDVGWNKTAAIWGARDNQKGIVYLYGEYYRGMAEPVVHTEAIKSMGPWMDGVIDPAADGRSQVDGRKLLTIYREQGLNLEKAANAVEAGHTEVLRMMSSGRLKVFKSCANWLMEFRTYQRDVNGNVVDGHKYHLMACTRYFILSGRDRMKVPVRDEQKPREFVYTAGSYPGSWMGK